MIFIRILLLVAALLFSLLLVWAQLYDPQSLPDAFMAMFQAPWTTTAIVDLYIGFGLMALLIIIVEASWQARLAWAIPIFLLGNVVSLIWFAWRLPEITARLSR